jgi:hypothetical protein
VENRLLDDKRIQKSVVQNPPDGHFLHQIGN